MKCLNPYRKKNPRYPEESNYKYIDCPCGKCLPCLQNRRKQWLIRLETECSAPDTVGSLFVTLTYDDSYCDGYLHKDHLQKFIKRLRHDVQFKYYAIGEYGTTTFRPHYHLIIFLKSLPRCFDGYDLLATCMQLVQSQWKYGFTSCFHARSDGLNYVLHYHVRPKFPFGKKVRDRKTFCTMSNGLGMSLIKNPDGSYNDELITHLQHSSNRAVLDKYGRRFYLPRYYTKKLEDLGIRLYDNSLPPDVTTVMSDDFSSPDLLSALNQRFATSYPDAQFDSSGFPVNYPPSVYYSFINDCMRISDEKLDRYNYQQKTSI